MEEKMIDVSGKWRELPSLKIARSHPATAACGGRIYAIGGGGPNFKSLNTVEVYDPGRNLWEFAREMPTLRSGAMAATIGGRIYVIGGGFKQPSGTFRFLPTVEVYDPRADRWESGPDMLMPHDYPALAYFQEKIYILGGHHPKATEGGPRTDPGFDFCERWSPGEPGWREVAPLTVPRFALSAAVFEGNLLAFGGVAFTPEGFNNFDFVERYDPAKNLWEKNADLRLPWPGAAIAVCLMEGKLYIFGGYSTDFVHPRAARYDPKQAVWQNLPPMPEPRAATTAVPLDGKIYLAGGWAADGRTPMESAIVFEERDGR
jgi:N-acetylneuraminic acid mutarotase